MNEQKMREKVIKGLECCGYSTFMDKCQECPYDGKDCFKRLKADALALLKAQEPVVMAGAELTDAELIEEIRKAPIVLKPNVDAVTVVRCRDCKYGETDTNGCGEDMVMCQNKLNPIGYEDWLMPPEFYCADGEWRDDDALSGR